MKYIKGTGGGPYITPPVTETEEEKQLASTIELSMKGLKNAYDCDEVNGM